ncbi:MAG: ABC transporter permease subunit [Microthrixaceae bacterium]
MRIDWSIVGALLRRDLAAARRSKGVVIPMLVVPVVLLVLLPTGIGWYARTATAPPDLSAVLGRLPGSLARSIATMPPAAQIVQLVLGYLVAPLFLIVPMMISSALAADAFAGEKERRTLETLLHLPIDERDLFVEKVLFAWLPTVGASWICFALFSVSANVVAWPVLGHPFMPTWRWVGLITLVAPSVAALGLGVMVRVSARARSTQEANQLGGAVIMPLILATVGQSSALLILPSYWMPITAVVITGLGLILVRGGLRRFDRDTVAARM